MIFLSEKKQRTLKRTIFGLSVLVSATGYTHTNHQFLPRKKLICDLIGHVFHNNDLDVMENEMYDMLVELEETLRKLLRRVAKNDDVLKISDNIIRF